MDFLPSSSVIPVEIICDYSLLTPFLSLKSMLHFLQKKWVLGLPSFHVFAMGTVFNKNFKRPKPNPKYAKLHHVSNWSSLLK